MSQTRFIVAGNFIDGRGADVRRNVFLAVKDGVITSIGSVADLPSDASTIDDFSHCVIVPALVDCSVSLSKSPSVVNMTRLADGKTDIAKKFALFEQHIIYCHTHGVLGVAESDDISDLESRYQDGMAKGNMIDIKRSHSPGQSRQESKASSSGGGDFIKISYSGNIEDDNGPDSRFDHEELCRFLQHKGTQKAVVVANGEQQVAEALEAGCDAIEQGYAMGEDNLREMARKGVLWIPSVLRSKNALDGASTGGTVCCRFSLRYVAPGKPIPGAEDYWKKMLAEQLRQLRLARELGVKTAVGSGAGSVGILHGESIVEEMKLFIKAGYSLNETIRCASENGARFFGMENLGQLTVGRKATFLMTRGSVKQLPRKLAYLEGIYVDGFPSVSYHKNPIKRG